MKNLLLFGASGSIGASILAYFLDKGCNVVGVSRLGQLDVLSDNLISVSYDPFRDNLQDVIDAEDCFDAVCWAQGANCNDSILDYDGDEHLTMYRANCMYVLESLNQLLESSLLAQSARLCIISSIWQNIARQNKLSYTVSKAAIEGIVNSVAVDLASQDILINAVLPGALDTKMTRDNVSADQLNKLEASTLFNKLAKTTDIASLVFYLCSEDNKAITGQSIAVDYGFSYTKLL